MNPPCGSGMIPLTWPAPVSRWTSPFLIAKRLAPNERVACASPAYLASRGEPRTPEDLAAHDCIALRENDEDVTLWRFTHVNEGRTATIRVKPVISSNDGDVVRGWGLGGLGVIVRSEWDVADC